MKVHVRFFATLADAARISDLQVDTQEGCTVAQLWETLAGRYPELQPHTKTILRAVNETFSTPETVLHEGDEVAFFPPVSGG